MNAYRSNGYVCDNREIVANGVFYAAHARLYNNSPELVRNSFALLRTSDMDTETTGEENTLPEQVVLRKPGRPHQ
jgi:hypothetical protein